MNKELGKIEEAIQRLRGFKNIKVMYGNTFAMHIEQLEQLQDDIETVLNYIDNSISKEVIEKKYKEAENEVIRIREENIKNNNATKYDYLIVGKRDAYKELLEGK